MKHILFFSRYLMLFAVISSLISTIIVLFLGVYEVYISVIKLIFFITNYVVEEYQFSDIVHHIINSVDLFLTSTVLLIFCVGLYELFIEKFSVKMTNEKNNEFNVLLVQNLDQLKTKLVQTIIMILIVEFFQKATQLYYQTSVDLVYFSCSIILVSIAAYITHSKH